VEWASYCLSVSKPLAHWPSLESLWISEHFPCEGREKMALSRAFSCPCASTEPPTASGDEPLAGQSRGAEEACPRELGGRAVDEVETLRESLPPPAGRRHECGQEDFGARAAKEDEQQVLPLRCRIRGYLVPLGDKAKGAHRSAAFESELVLQLLGRWLSHSRGPP
jgi:hypothetical protein